MVEVLVALAIISMMTMSTFVAFNNTRKASTEFEAVQVRYHGIRLAMNRMATEISLAYLSQNRPAGEEKHYTLFEGREDFGSDNLTFSSFAHLRVRQGAKESDQTVIQFFVEEDDEGVINLYRRESRRLEGDLPEQMVQFVPAYILLEDVQSLKFDYWDPSRREWREDWSTVRNDAQPDRLPSRVKITLEVDNDGESEFFTTQTVILMEEKIDLSK